MSHVRTQIRAALVATLGAIASILERVVDDPASIQDADASPWVQIALGTEQVTPQTLGGASGRRLIRALPVFMEIHTRGAGAAIDLAESIAADIEAAIFAAGRLSGLLLGPMTLVGMEPSIPDQSGSLPARSLRLQWNSTYSTAASNATVAT